MDNNTRAQLSYDAMLARGDGRGDEPTYAAPVRISGLRFPALKDEAAIRKDLTEYMTLDSLEVVQGGDETWVEAEGTLEEVQAGAEDDEKADLFKALEKLGYEPDAIDVLGYQEAVLDWQD